MLTDKQIASYLDSLEDQILKENKKRVELTYRWVGSFPARPGVYVVFEDTTLVYVGETGNIRGRMRDLLDSRHHTLRRSIGKLHFHKVEGYQDANSRRKFPLNVEQMVNKWLVDKVLISAIPLSLGRKELEEVVIKKFSPKYNKKGERITA